MASPSTVDLQSAAASVERMADTASKNAADVAARIKDEATEQFDRLSVTIRRNPLQSAAIAASVGFLFAVVARR